MFFDPTCKPETKADPFSLESLIAWLEKQGPATEYDYTKPSECMAGQYFRSCGLGADKYNVGGPMLDDLIPGLWMIASGWRSTGISSHTFGDALNRARETLARTGG